MGTWTKTGSVQMEKITGVHNIILLLSFQELLIWAFINMCPFKTMTIISGFQGLSMWGRRPALKYLPSLICSESLLVIYLPLYVISKSVPNFIYYIVEALRGNEKQCLFPPNNVEKQALIISLQQFSLQQHHISFSSGSISSDTNIRLKTSSLKTFLGSSSLFSFMPISRRTAKLLEKFVCTLFLFLLKPK